MDAKYGTPTVAPKAPAVVQSDVSELEKMWNTPAPAPAKPQTLWDKYNTATKGIQDTLGKTAETVGKTLTTSERRFGETIGQTIAAPKTIDTLSQNRQNEQDMTLKVIKQIAENKKAGKDTAHLEWTLMKATQDNPEMDAMIKEIIPSLDKTTRQVLGEAGGVLADLVTAGGISKTAGVAKKAIGVKQGIIQGLKTGAVQGATAGAVQGATGAMQENKTVGEIAGATAIGATAGGVLGGVIGGVTGGVSGYVNKQAADKAEAANLIFSGNTTDARTAKFKLAESTQPTTIDGVVGNTQARTFKTQIEADPIARKAIDTGIDEGDVALIKASTPKDKEKMSQMLAVVQKAKSDKTYLGRATDISGESFVTPARHIQQTNKKAAAQLDTVAKESLLGRPLDWTSTEEQWRSQLSNRGVGIDENDTLHFSDSDFEGMDSVQKTLQRLHKRMTEAQGADAYKAHQLKRFIDEQVNYGKQSADGLTGGAERIMKSLRKNIDTTLDTSFPEYNAVNTQYSETRDYLDEIQKLMGKDTNLSDELTGKKAGTLMRRILSNTQSRTEVLRMLSNTEELAKKYGFKSDENILHQVLFADTIEKLFGSEAPTSFLGQGERAAKTAVDLASTSGLLRKGAKMVTELGTKNATNEAKVSALQKLLGVVKDIQNIPGKQGGYIRVGSKKVSAIDEPSKREILDIVNYMKTGATGKELTTTAHLEDAISRYAEKYGINLDAKNVTQKFQNLLDKTKTIDRLPG